MPRKAKKTSDRRRKTSSSPTRGSSETAVPKSQFGEQLQAYLSQLSDLHSRGASEDSIRDYLLQFLRSALPGLRQTDPILLEKHIPALRVRGGYADALYGDLIFEFKRQLDDASRAEGQGELERYLRNQQHPERFFGILTDGLLLEVHVLRDGELQRVDELALAIERAGEAKLWLDCYLFHDKNLVPTANDVALRFGERSPAFLHSRRVLAELWQQVGANATAQTKFVEWQSLLSIVYGSAVGDEGLFLRHTYLALFSRALAFTALERRAPDANELSGIITGQTFVRMGFVNFAGDDFFTWITEPTVLDVGRGLIWDLATRLTVAYDLQAIHEDLLKELYQELVDPQTRHDLGEFYTPDWLAELTLRKAGFPTAVPKKLGQPSLFDPSCGSGTFLFTAVRLLRESGMTGKKLVQFCETHVAGIDVHPLAVAIAKTNLLLALGEDVRSHREGVTLPVYMADTLTGAEPDNAHREILVNVGVDEIAKRSGKSKPRGVPTAFGIPSDLADHPDQLHAAVDGLLDLANPALEPADAESGFRHRLEEIGIPEAQQLQWEANLDLMRWLLQPPATNSVWRFILNNAYQPQLLARRKFAFVVGNPPWLAYFQIKRREYQERVRKLAASYGLVEKSHLGLIGRTELATLFFAFCADRFLANDGHIAFVMPRSVLTGAKQHASFGRRYLAKAEYLVDCEQVTPLFNVPACVVIAVKPTKDVQPLQPLEQVPLLHLHGALPGRNESYGRAMSVLEQHEDRLVAAADMSISDYRERIVQGADIIPRCLWFVRPPREAWVVDRRRPQLETDTTTERFAKAPWKGIRISGSVEADFLFATLLSSHLLPFGSRQFSLVALPLAHDGRGEGQVIAADEAVRRGKIRLAKWLQEAERMWAKNAKSSELVQSVYDRLDYLKKMTKQRPQGTQKLLYNAAGTHLCACVVDVTDVEAWEIHEVAVRGFIADQTTYWFETNRSNEAHYLCAVLNAPFVDEAIKPYQTKGAFGARHGGGHRHIHRRPFEVLPIPRFSRKDERHRQLATLSQRCHRKVAQAVLEARSDGDERFLTAPIGRLRTKLRRELLGDELAQIDALVAEILKV